MSDPLSLLLAEDEGDTSALFSSSTAPDPTPPPTTISGYQEPDGLRGLDASKIKIGKPKKGKKEKGKKEDEEDEGPEPAKLYHGSGLGLGVTTTTTNTSHVREDAGSGED